jgi:hypothetical protein
LDLIALVIELEYLTTRPFAYIDRARTDDRPRLILAPGDEAKGIEYLVHAPRCPTVNHSGNIDAG